MKAPLILSLLLMSACSNMFSVVAATPVQLSARQIAQIEGTVANDLYDRDTAHFRNLRAADVTTSNGAIVRRVCGEVSGKNPMGSYGLYSAFGGVLTGGVYVDEDYPIRCEIS
ncbi:MAG: hypothetical protein ABIV25_02520 [Paracoccaceae bacterium]